MSKILKFFENYSFLIKLFFNITKRSQKKNVSQEGKLLLTWNKKHFLLFSKGFQLSETVPEPRVDLYSEFSYLKKKIYICSIEKWYFWIVMQNVLLIKRSSHALVENLYLKKKLWMWFLVLTLWTNIGCLLGKIMFYCCQSC